MSAGWVAATTRGGALVQRLVGPDGARDLATTRSWPDARRLVAATFYGADLPIDADRSAARRHAVEATSWQLRVLAGWMPPGQSVLARLFAGPMEIANIERRLALLEGRDPDPPIGLGSLAVAWPRVASANSPEQVRGALATSVWGDPGGIDRTTIALSLRLGWVRRLASQYPRLQRGPRAVPRSWLPANNSASAAASGSPRTGWSMVSSAGTGATRRAFPRSSTDCPSQPRGRSWM